MAFNIINSRAIPCIITSSVSGLGSTLGPLARLRLSNLSPCILLIRDELVEGAKHDMMIPLRLEVHLGELCVQTFEEREHLPETQGNAQLLQLVLEELCVHFFFDQDICWNQLHV